MFYEENKMLDDILGQARELPMLSPSATKEYKEKRPALVKFVNQAMGEHPMRDALIGNAPIDVMENNHSNHADFMSNVFQLGLHEIMVKIVIWVYRSYHARGFSYDYFSESLHAWVRAVEANLSPPNTQDVLALYNWLIGQHQQFITLSKTIVNPEYETGMHWQKMRLQFTQALLEGNSQACLSLASDSVHDKEGVKNFYLQVIQPAMYDIGYGWESGRISISQEHLASAIIARVMSTFYQKTILEKTQKHKVAVVTAAPNEFHEIGAHMVADFLELDGWNVYYLGANTPSEEIIRTIIDKKPFLLAVSVTMPFNLDNVKNTIETIHTKLPDSNIKIMTGGLSFNMGTPLWKKLGADGYAANAQEAVNLAQTWYEQEHGTYA